jgi:TolB-like protein/Tfp pilus assembly protein PilF/DNA-binding winged helix-turn-helix (wHTH) protein
MEATYAAGAPERNVRLAILGSFSLRDAADREIAPRSRKNRALLAVLALSTNRTMTRERIATLLWGDHGDEQARASLRQSLAMLRKELGPFAETLVQAHGDMLTLPDRGIEIDALDVLNPGNGEDIAALRRAAENCRGELLADVSLHDGSFEDWLETERSRLRAAAIRLFERLAQQERGPARIEAARRLLQFDELRESSHRALMRAYADAGDNGLALKQYEQCKALIRDQLGAAPAQETKDLRREIAAGVVGSRDAEAAYSNATVAPPALPDRPSIAVMPFDNADPDPDRTFFSDGIAEEVIANLSRFRRLFVIARASSFAFRGEAKSAREIGYRLGVRFVLYGRVRRAGAGIRVTAELVETESEIVLWVEKYDRPADEILGLIDELSATIVASTVGRLEDQMLRQARRRPPGSLAAYELVLRGRALMHSDSREDKLSARKMFEEAIAIDGSFAMAYALLAYVHLYEFFWDTSRVALARAADIASKALAIDEEEAWCHMVLGLTYLHRREFDLALKHSERSVALNPNDPELAAKFGLVLTDLGRSEEAIPQIERAIRLSPLNPEAFSDYMALALIGARRYEAAIAILKHAPQPSFYYYAWLAVCHARLGDLAEARSNGAKSLEMAPNFTVSIFAAMEPIRDPVDLAIWTDALKLSGIPG